MRRLFYSMIGWKTASGKEMPSIAGVAETTVRDASSNPAATNRRTVVFTDVSPRWPVRTAHAKTLCYNFPDKTLIKNRGSFNSCVQSATWTNIPDASSLRVQSHAPADCKTARAPSGPENNSVPKMRPAHHDRSGNPRHTLGFS